MDPRSTSDARNGGSDIALRLHMEFELKFQADTSAIERLRANELSGVETRLVRSVYFDTQDRDLRAAGMSLRVRDIGDCRVQTLKGLNGVDRFEREAPLAGVDPDLSRLSDIPAANVLAGARVLPVFETRVRRAARIVAEGEARIELALDEGEIIAGARSAPIGELELELKAGDPGDLFRLAEKLRAAHGLRLALSSKAERGYDLAAGETQKALAPALLPETSAREAFQALAQADLAAFETSLRRVQAGESVEAVHHARVALRRLRAILRAFREMVDDERRPALEQTLRHWAGRFGKARDLDVFVSETFRPLARHEPGGAAFGRRLLSAQGEARETVRRGMMEGEADTFLLSTLEWVLAGEWVEAAGSRPHRELPLRKIGPSLLDATWKGFRKRGKGLDWWDAPARHRLRIQAKKLRYLADALDGAFPRPREFAKRLRRFQDAAGRLNDIHLAAELSRRVLGESAPMDAVFAAGAIIGAARSEEPELIRQARKAYAALLSHGPYWR